MSRTYTQSIVRRSTHNGLVGAQCPPRLRTTSTRRSPVRAARLSSKCSAAWIGNRFQSRSGSLECSIPSPRWRGAVRDLITCLSPGVQTARQALAIDERRLKFAPLLWQCPTTSEPEDPAAVSKDSPQVKQVWFQGAHADIGGGAGGEVNGLANTALLWMLLEAHMNGGLEVNYRVLDEECGGMGDLEANKSLNSFFRTVEAPLRLGRTLVPHHGYKGRDRILRPRNAIGVSVASSAVCRYGATSVTYFSDGVERSAPLPKYHPNNLREMIQQQGSGMPTEDVDYLPYDIPFPRMLFKLLPEGMLLPFTADELEKEARELFKKGGYPNASWGRVRKVR